jgi:hypothetical protein
MAITKQQLQNFVDAVIKINNDSQAIIEISIAVNSPAAQIVLDRVNATQGTTFTLADVKQTAIDVLTGAL